MKQRGLVFMVMVVLVGAMTARAAERAADPAGSPVASPTGAAAVAMFRGNPARTGAMPGPGPAGGPSLAWRFHTGGTIFSSPAVAGGVVYVGSDDGNLYAVDAATGQERWRFAARGKIGSSPAVVAGVVYVGSQDQNLYAVDAATGQERWRFHTGGTTFSSPAVRVRCERRPIDGPVRP